MDSEPDTRGKAEIYRVKEGGQSSWKELKLGVLAEEVGQNENMS